MSPIPHDTPSSAASSSTGTSGPVTTASAAADQNMFLQLLVAQLQNQDPMQPMDSSTFVTQLAQFQQLQSTVSMGQDISGIRSDADQLLTDYQTSQTATTGAGAAGQTQP